MANVVSEANAYRIMMSMFADIWDGVDGATVALVDEMDQQLGWTDREDNFRAKWKRYKYEMIMELCLDAFLQDAGDRKTQLEDDIETRGWTEVYQIYSATWEADGVRDQV
jgi:hypothetical protein